MSLSLLQNIFYQNNVHLFLSYLVEFYIHFVFYLSNIVVNNKKITYYYFKQHEPSLICTWHNNIIYIAYILYKKNIKCNIVISQHNDTKVLSCILKRWGFSLIKGSSNKGSISVIKKMHNAFKNKQNIAIAADGPKGPKGIIKFGAFKLAMQYDANLRIIMSSSTKYWKLKTWDELLIPKPLSKVSYVISNNIKIEKNKLLSTRFYSDLLNKFQYKVNSELK